MSDTTVIPQPLGLPPGALGWANAIEQRSKDQAVQIQTLQDEVTRLSRALADAIAVTP